MDCRMLGWRGNCRAGGGGGKNGRVEAAGLAGVRARPGGRSECPTGRPE